MNELTAEQHQCSSTWIFYQNYQHTMIKIKPIKTYKTTKTGAKNVIWRHQWVAKAILDAQHTLQNMKDKQSVVVSDKTLDDQIKNLLKTY
jgi:hypothetical protein